MDLRHLFLSLKFSSHLSKFDAISKLHHITLTSANGKSKSKICTGFVYAPVDLNKKDKVSMLLVSYPKASHMCRAGAGTHSALLRLPPRTKAFTVPLTGRWGDQLTRRPGPFHVRRVGVWRAQDGPESQLLWQGKGLVLLWAGHSGKRTDGDG